MSAWLCDHAHWDVVAELIRRYNQIDDDLFDAVGRENCKSIKYRYPQDVHRTRRHFTARRKYERRAHLLPSDFSPHIAGMVICSYRYQSCEHPGWDGCFIDTITQFGEALFHNIPNGKRYPGWSMTPELLDLWIAGNFDGRKAFAATYGDHIVGEFAA